MLVLAMLLASVACKACEERYSDVESLPRECQDALSQSPNDICPTPFSIFRGSKLCDKKHRECLNQYYTKIEEACGSEFMLDANIHLFAWGITSIGNPSRSSLSCLDVQSARFTMNVYLGFMCIPHSKLASTMSPQNMCGIAIDKRESTVGGCQDKCAWGALDFRCQLGSKGMKLAQELIPVMNYMYGTNGSLYRNIHDCDQFQTAVTCNGTFEATSPAEEFHFPSGNILTTNAGTVLEPLFGMLLVAFLTIL